MGGELGAVSRTPAAVRPQWQHTLEILKGLQPNFDWVCVFCTMQPKGQCILLCFVQRRAPLLRPRHLHVAALGELQRSRSADTHSAHRQRGTFCRVSSELCLVLTSIFFSFSLCEFYNFLKILGSACSKERNPAYLPASKSSHQGECSTLTFIDSCKTKIRHSHFCNHYTI